jgi:D-alanine-D-alanine ligase
MKRVAVLRGGPSSEYEVSLKSGGAVLEVLRKLDYIHKDIIITKNGEWLESGIVRSPEKALEAVDVVFLALHGEYGEDGQVQRLLQRLNIPFNGSNAFTSAVAFNKELTKRTLKESGVLMPSHRRIDRQNLYNLDSDIDYIKDTMHSELFVKPTASGSSVGARHISEISSLKQTLQELLTQHESVLVEEFIRGKEATVGVIEELRDHDLYVLPAVEIIPPSGLPFFSAEVKYNGATTEICPGRFSYDEKTKLAEAAAIVHRALHCTHYSRSDFIVRNGEVYFLEINTLPGLTNESLFPKAAAAIGLDFKDLIHHLIKTSKV